jgi:sugar phosphate isomerase/epimerase
MPGFRPEESKITSPLPVHNTVLHERTAGSFEGPLGVQLWCFRRELESDVPGTLAKVKAMGFDNVEAYSFGGLTPGQFRMELDKAGLKVIALHWNELLDWKTRPDSIFAWAKIIGADKIGIAWLKDTEQDTVTREKVVSVADIINGLAAKARAQGLKLYYHIHGYEFQPSDNGLTFFDEMMQKVIPGNLELEMDVFWVVYSGQDPVKLFKKYGKWITMMHLKSMADDVHTGVFNGADFMPSKMPDRYWTSVGKGKIDFVPILREAKKYGVKWYFLEDESSNYVKEIEASVAYLKSVNL